MIISAALSGFAVRSVLPMATATHPLQRAAAATAVATKHIDADA
jgi:hypothetical protein